MCTFVVYSLSLSVPWFFFWLDTSALYHVRGNKRFWFPGFPRGTRQYLSRRYSLVLYVWFTKSILQKNKDFLYHLGAILKKKKKLFSNFSFLVEDAEKWIKHHFFVYLKSISDQNFKGISQKIGLSRPWEAQNWNGCGGCSFWATTFKFWGNSYFLKIFKR